MTQYTLTVNEEQARVIRNALELYSRVHMGQLDYVAEQFLPYAKGRGFDTLQALREGLGLLCSVWTGLPSNSYHGIFSPEIQESARVAWDLQQVIRHRLAWDREPKGGIYVDFDPPFHTANGVPLAKIERVENSSQSPR